MAYSIQTNVVDGAWIVIITIARLVAEHTPRFRVASIDGAWIAIVTGRWESGTGALATGVEGCAWIAVITYDTIPDG